jgi:hypothetical protein
MENTKVEEKKAVAEKIAPLPDPTPTKVLTGEETVMVEGANGMVEVGSMLPDPKKAADEASVARMTDDGAVVTGPVVTGEGEVVEMSGASIAKVPMEGSPVRSSVKPVAASASMAEVAAPA